jgi:glycosyltransferase involved in cell wall biosynthesis
MISVLILSLDEQQNIRECLESVAWSDDVVVLDSFSRDKTVDLAKEAGARVLQNRFSNFAQQRNYGVANAGLKHKWVLHLDADERVTRELLEEMQQVVAHTSLDAFRIALKVMFLGRWVKHAGMYPSYQVRLGHRDRLRFVQVGHGQRESLALDRLGTIKEPLVHYAFSKGLGDWFDRHNRYSTDEARHYVETGARQLSDWKGLFTHDTLRRRRALKHLSFRLPFRPRFRFIYMYLFRLGFLDGAAGLNYCRLLAAYELMIDLKVKEACRRGVPVEANRTPQMGSPGTEDKNQERA